MGDMEIRTPSLDGVADPPARECRSTVCFFNTRRAWGGGEKWHLEAARYFAERGDRVLVVAHRDGELARRARAAGLPCETFRIGALSFLNPLTVFRLRRLFRGRGVGTVLMNGSSDLKAAGLAARWAGVPRIVYRRGLARRIRGTPLNRLFLGRVVTRIIANSEATKGLVREDMPRTVPCERVEVVYNGLDFAAYTLQSAPFRFSVPDGTVLIGTLGRLAPEKGHTLLIRVAKILKNRGLRFHVLIAGAGELDDQLVRARRDEGVDDCVTLVGFQEEVAGYLSALDVFVLPSLWEGFGYAMVEASYHGKPVVAFDTGSNPEVVVDGVTGFLVPPGRVDLMADRISQLAADPELARRMGAAGRAYVMERFGLERSLERVRVLCDLSPSVVEERMHGRGEACLEKSGSPATAGTTDA